jgi:hypothetical protein
VSSGTGLGAVQARFDRVAVVLHRGALAREGAAGLAIAVAVVVLQLPLPGRELAGVTALDRGHQGSSSVVASASPTGTTREEPRPSSQPAPSGWRDPGPHRDGVLRSGSSAPASSAPALDSHVSRPAGETVFVEQHRPTSATPRPFSNVDTGTSSIARSVSGASGVDPKSEALAGRLGLVLSGSPRFQSCFQRVIILQDLQTPSKRKPAVSSGLSVERTGIEPVTSGLQSRCSPS